jgi:hypothetical protein
MPGEREPLRIIKAEPHYAEGQSLQSDTYSVYLTLNRSLTLHEETLINAVKVPRPLGIGVADSKLPKTMIIWKTTIEQVAAARDEIKAFLSQVESEGLAAELEATDKADKAAAAADAEVKRRQAIADSIDWG